MHHQTFIVSAPAIAGLDIEDLEVRVCFDKTNPLYPEGWGIEGIIMVGDQELPIFLRGFIDMRPLANRIIKDSDLSEQIAEYLYERNQRQESTEDLLDTLKNMLKD